MLELLEPTAATGLSRRRRGERGWMGPHSQQTDAHQDRDTHIHHHCRQDEDMNDVPMLVSRHTAIDG